MGNKKKELLVVSMLNDQTTDENHSRYIKNANVTLDKIQDSLVKGKVKHDALVLVDYTGSTNGKWNNINGYSKSKTINWEIKTDNWLGVDNVLHLNTVDGDVKDVNAEDFDFILPPEEYNLTFAGVDLFGTMSNTMSKLAAKGYITRIYTDVTHVYNTTAKTLKSANIIRRVVDYNPKGK